MKKFMFLVIFILSGIIMYQGGCFDDCALVRVLVDDPMEPIIKVLEGDGRWRDGTER